MIELKAQKRDKKENLDNLRKEGKIPAVVYGKKQESISISVDSREFIKAFRESGESTSITLDLDGQKFETLVQEVLNHPIKEQFLHIDFLAIDATKPVEVSVPLEFIGISQAVKSGGTLVKVLRELEIKALPKNLPHQIEVDISVLINADSQIQAKDIKLPSGVELTTEQDEIIATIDIGKDELEGEQASVDFSAIEVEKKGKKEEEE